MRRLLMVVVAVLAAGWALAQEEAAPPPGSSPFLLQAVPVQGRSQRILHGWERDGVVYLSADDLSRVLGATFHWRSELGKVSLVVDGGSAWVMDGSEFAILADGSALQLPGPAFLWGGRMMVPIDLVVNESGSERSWISREIRYDRATRRLVAEVGRDAAISGARIVPDALGWKLVVEGSGSLETEMLRTERASFVFRIDDVEYDPLLFTLPSEHSWFQGLRFRPVIDGVEVAFSTGPGAEGWRLNRSGGRVEVFLGLDERDLREGTLRPFTAARSVLPTEVRVVVLDPGHAADGDDSWEGAHSYDICARLATRLRDRFGFEVLLTHERDFDADGETRAERANRGQGDLLVSLHVHQRSAGPAAFVARTPLTDASGSAELDRLGFRSFETAQRPLLPASRLLAQNLVQALAERLDTPALGVQEESLAELQGAVMPAALIEVGAPPGGLDLEARQAVVDGLMEGIQLYLLSGDEFR